MGLVVEVIEQFVDADGCRLWTVRQGRGPAMVLCHGGPGGYDTLGPIAGMIDDLVTVYRYDQRGCGRSQDVGAYTPARFVADLDAIRQHNAIDRWIVAGHSAGADLALQYAVEHPRRVAALVLLNGVGFGRTWTDAEGNEVTWSAAYRAARSAKLSEAERSRLSTLTDRDERHRIIDRTDYHDLTSAVARQSWDAFPANWRLNQAITSFTDESHAPRVSLLDVPALLIHGRSDPRPLQPVQRLAEMLPRATLHVVEGMGHYPYLEAVEAFRAHLRTFIADVLCD